jgi:SET domain-containing protein
VVSLNVYENPSFCSTLNVFKNGISTPWLNLKLSSIKNSGLGVFSLRNFKVGEFITDYLGKVSKNPLDEEYTFKKINRKPVNSASGLLEDYWLGHRIQHESGDQVNVTITAGYEIKAKKEIEIGEELFVDYNRSKVCGKCEAESDFYDLCFKKSKKCNFCGNMRLKLKKCSYCEACFICLQCYDKKQITF